MTPSTCDSMSNAFQCTSGAVCKKKLTIIVIIIIVDGEVHRFLKTLAKTGLEGRPISTVLETRWTAGESQHQKLIVSRNIGSVEELDTITRWA